MSVSLPPTILYLNPGNGIAINMKAYHVFFAADLLIDAKTIFTNFLDEKEEFYIDSDVREIVLRTCTGRFKVHPIDLMPEIGINTTQLTFQINVANARAQVFFRPTVTFLK